MLTEHVIASIAAPRQKLNTSYTKDAAIFLHEILPHATQRAVFKKSATLPNCLALSSTHIYAAQADSALVNVYNREKSSQEASVAFKERITSLALACDDVVLVLGTEEGRIYLWETHTGRIVATSQSHLQSVTALAVDLSSNFLLSGSADSSVHVWSIPSLLSFSSPSSAGGIPLHTLSGHRDAITSLTLGHSASSCNIAVSASKDNTCIVWDYHANNILRIILLPSAPLCVALDPADRAVYCGYEDGSVHFVDFYGPSAIQDSLVGSAQNGAATEQPDPKYRWEPPSNDVGAALCMSVSYDGSKLFTGHDSGKMVMWDIPTGRFLSQLTTPPLPGPVTNLITLPVTGFPKPTQTRLKQHAVVKPRFGEVNDNGGQVPAKYTISAQLVGNLPRRKIAADQADIRTPTDFELALTHPSFPSDMLASCIADLATHRQVAATPTAQNEGSDFMALDEPKSDRSENAQLQKQNRQLEEQLASLKRVQKASFVQITSLTSEKKELLAKVQTGTKNSDTEMEALEKAEQAWNSLGRSGRAGKGRRG